MNRIRTPHTPGSHLPTAHHVPSLLCSTHGPHRTTVAGFPQPNAVRRLDGAGGHPGRAARDRSPCPGQPAGRRHCGESEPRRRIPAFEPEIPPDGPTASAKPPGCSASPRPQDFVRAYPVSREWLTLLIRRMDAVASVYRLAASTLPKASDGLAGRTLSSTAGGASTPPSRCTTAATSAWSARDWPCVAGPSTTGSGP